MHYYVVTTAGNPSLSTVFLKDNEVQGGSWEASVPVRVSFKNCCRGGGGGGGGGEGCGTWC